MDSQASLGAKIYKDFKMTLKALLIFAIALSVFCGGFYVYEKISSRIKSNNLIERAEKAVKKENASIFSRNDLGDVKLLQVWDINDSDKNILVKVDNKASIFSQSVRNSYIHLSRVAGNACDFAEAEIKENKVTGFSCDGKYFSRVSSSKN